MNSSIACTRETNAAGSGMLSEGVDAGDGAVNVRYHVRKGIFPQTTRTTRRQATGLSIHRGSVHGSNAGAGLSSPLCTTALLSILLAHSSRLSPLL